MTTNARSLNEVNFDCLVGPTHHFGGLSNGNLASQKNQRHTSNPKAAALQGLNKMRFLAERGFKQALLPPHYRPHLPTLHGLGFGGSDTEIFKQAHQHMPEIFSKLCSSSAMWAANAATVSPSIDSLDHKVHITLANLITMFHRSIEHNVNYQLFQRIFSQQHFVIHHALPAHDLFSDEGAANHNRLCPNYSYQGLQIFVYGKEAERSSQKSQIYPSRQSKRANEALIRLHKLDPSYVINIEQNPAAIDQGAFHNDVVAVANEQLFLLHELAFNSQKSVLESIKNNYQKLYQQDLKIIEISNHDLDLRNAVSSYLFNSQILTKPDGSMLLFAPLECQNNQQANQVIKYIISSDNPINEVEFFDLTESMSNGGGPACLRLRMVLSTQEQQAINSRLWFSQNLYNKLNYIINKYYVDEFYLELLFDELFYRQSLQALDEIYETLGLKQI